MTDEIIRTCPPGTGVDATPPAGAGCHHILLLPRQINQLSSHFRAALT